MSLLKSNDKAMIVGVSDSGKTYLLRHLLKVFEKQGVDFLVYDSEREKTFDDLKPKQRYKPKSSSVDEFDYVCGKVYEARNLVFAIESIDLFSPPFKPVPPNLWKLVHWGRKRNIGLIMTSRRIASVHKDPCSQCKHWFIFFTFLPNDIDYMRKFVGETAKQAENLQPRYFIYWTQNKSQVCSPITGDA